MGGKQPPKAEVLNLRQRIAQIRCPYCDHIHRHVLIRLGHQHFAPQCGLRLNPNDRATGYTFDTRNLINKQN